MTAHAMSSGQKSLDAGMNNYMAKHIDTDKLYGCLLQWIDPDKYKN